jgi:hypothetical protein
MAWYFIKAQRSLYSCELGYRHNTYIGIVCLSEALLSVPPVAPAEAITEDFIISALGGYFVFYSAGQQLREKQSLLSRELQNSGTIAFLPSASVSHLFVFCFVLIK